MWVKICANTNAADALRAAELGADAVGFVFAPSKRQVTAAQVRQISESLPSTVERTGVFSTSDPEAIAATMREANLLAAQMHGGLDLESADRLRSLIPGAEIIHVLHWNLGDDISSAHQIAQQLLALEHTRLDERILIDAKFHGASGGLGIAFNWSEAAALLNDFSHLRLIVAGGLRPDNVSTAIRALRPFGVDVASGVESTPGHKDQHKMQLFLEAARAGF